MTLAEFRLRSGQHVTYDGEGFTFSGSDLTLSRGDLFDLMGQLMARETAALEAAGFKLYTPGSGESGGSISEMRPSEVAALAERLGVRTPEPPVPNNSGGSYTSASCRAGDHGTCGLGVCRCECHLATLTVRDVDACTKCGRLGHLAENCETT